MKKALLVTATVLLLQASIASAAVKWKAPALDLGQMKATQLFSLDLKKLVVGTPSGSLKFGMDEAPKFIKLSPDGILSGMPKEADAGDHAFRLLVQDGDSGALATAKIRVVKTSPAPSLTCEGGTPAYAVGNTPDKKFTIFTCPVK
jgi:hypothetical protein